MTEAVDAVRKAEHRLLLAEGDETLKRTKYLWLFSEENLPERYEEWFARLKTLQLKTGRAWAIKESLRDLWSYRHKGWARRFWNEWYYWAILPTRRAMDQVQLSHFPRFGTEGQIIGKNTPPCQVTLAWHGGSRACGSPFRTKQLVRRVEILGKTPQVAKALGLVRRVVSQ